MPFAVNFLMLCICVVAQSLSLVGLVEAFHGSLVKDTLQWRHISTRHTVLQNVQRITDEAIPRRQIHFSHKWSSTTLMATTEPDMEAYASGYKTVFQEVSLKLCKPNVGQIPTDLVGSYFRCGPAMFSAGSIVPPPTSIVKPKLPPVPDGQDPDRMVLHPMEGDGAVLGITFFGDESDSNNDEVAVRYRFVRTTAFTNERKKGERIYKSMDSTRSMGASAGSGVGNDLPLPFFRHHLQPGLNKNRKNTSNTRAIYWGKRLMSLCEGSQPFKLDARAVSTEGRSQLGGAIRRESDSFGSKLSYDSLTNRALFYGVEPGLRATDLTIYEFNADFTLVENGRFSVDLPGFAMINDFCSTEHYAVFVQPNVAANPTQFLVGKEPGKCLSVRDDSASTLHLIPRAGAHQQFQKKSITIPLTGPSEVNIQFCNAFEKEDVVIIDAILSDGSSIDASSPPLSWPWGVSLEEYRTAAAKKSLWRYTVDTRNNAVTKQCLFSGQCSFGVVSQQVGSQKHRFIYMNVGGLESLVTPPQGIAKLDVESGDVETWMPESFEFCGEPMYAPRHRQESVAEDNGYILSVLWNGRTKESELIILESNNITAGPVTRIQLGMAIPHGLFGCFTSEVESIGTAKEIDRRAKLADKIESRGNKWNEVKSDFSGLGLRLDDMEEYFGDWNPFK